MLYFFFFKLVTPALTNQPMADLFRSSTFSSDQLLCNADIIGSSEARARIEVAVLNFLRILNSSSPAISDLPLVCCSFLSEAIYLLYQCLNSNGFCIWMRSGDESALSFFNFRLVLEETEVGQKREEDEYLNIAHRSAKFDLLLFNA